jgi:acyl carrier protein
VRADGLRAALHRKLPEYMIPSAFVVLDALPLMANGKVDRRALPPPDLAALASEHAFVAPRTPVEAALAQIWTDLLGRRQIGVHDDFFALGGHSLLATQVVSRVREALGVELPLRRLFEAPTVAAMAGRGTPYRGVLYAGLMLTVTGPKVLEFNCRLGDPEAQVVLPRLVTDPLEVMSACLEGHLNRISIKWGEQSYVGVVMASGGYPSGYATGMEITGLNVGDPDTPDTIVFHGATRLATGETPNKVVTNGGRVLTVVGRGISLAQARARAYDRVGGIRFHGAYYRTDIALVENNRPVNKLHLTTFGR